MICIPENSGGLGGIAGGAGANGQASQNASGAGANGYGYPVIELTTGMTTTQTVQLTRDMAGEVAADMTDVQKVMFKAWPSMVSHNDEISIDCPFDDKGQVTVTFTPEIVNYRNGVWYAEFECFNQDNQLTHTYRAYLCIRKGMEGSKDGAHTLTAMDVRLALMDTSAEANQLLDDLEFSDMMIYNAIERCIDEWNETPPALACIYNATNFPYREHLIKGAVGYLMQAIAYRYTRNRMQYSAAGMQLDTNDKGPQYVQLANIARAEWKAFIAAKKTEQNMSECFGTFSMPYFGSHAWW